MLVWDNENEWVDSAGKILIDGDIGVENSDVFVWLGGFWTNVLTEELKMVDRLKSEFDPSQRVEIMSHFCPKCGSDKFKCLCE